MQRYNCGGVVGLWWRGNHWKKESNRGCEVHLKMLEEFEYQAENEVQGLINLHTSPEIIRETKCSLYPCDAHMKDV